MVRHALTPEAEPLTILTRIEFGGFTNLRWSPTGNPFIRNLRKLCLNATSEFDICDVRTHFDGTLAVLQWVDVNHILFLTRKPSVLFLGGMDFSGNMDGTTLPIVVWSLEDWISSQSFAMAKIGR